MARPNAENFSKFHHHMTSTTTASTSATSAANISPLSLQPEWDPVGHAQLPVDGRSRDNVIADSDATGAS